MSVESEAKSTFNEDEDDAWLYGEHIQKQNSKFANTQLFPLLIKKLNFYFFCSKSTEIRSRTKTIKPAQMRTIKTIFT